MERQRDSFIFYRSFYEAIKDMSKEEQSLIFNAICELALNNNELELKGFPKIVFTLIKPQIEANYKRYLNGCKEKKKDKSKQEAKDKQDESKQETNVNVNPNLNINVNSNINDNENETLGDVAESYILEFTKNEMLRSKLFGFAKMRVEKNNFTLESFKSNLMKLDHIGSNDSIKIKIVDKAINNNWNTFYELKPEEIGTDIYPDL